MLYAAKSHIGLIRSMNQDGFIIVPRLYESNLFLVADGMGGASAGDVASQLAVDAVSAHISAHLLSDSDPSQVLVDAIRYGNEAIYQGALDNPSFQGMGTTVVCALATDASVHVGHVGDSRAYALLGESFRQVTKDHSLVAELVRRGQLTDDEAKSHPQRNIVTRSLGTEPQSTADVDTFAWAREDVILLCSDGLTDLVSDAELNVFLLRARDCEDVSKLDELLASMIQRALDLGGKDNVTALLAVNREERDTR